MRSNLQSLALSLSAISASLLTPEVRAQELLWSEEFNTDGAPDPTTWSYDVGFNNGWGNNELQTYTSEQKNVDVQNGALRITAIKEGNSFTSARIKTDNKFSFTYGTLVARIQVPDMNAGLWPAFWTMGSDFYQVGWPKSGEVDIMEMGQGLAINEGVVNRRVVSAAHWDIFGQYATYAKSLDFPEDLTLDYHEYKLEWTPTSMTTYVDDTWIWEIDIGDECPSCAELHQPHHILLSMAVGGGFTSGGTSSSAAGSSSSCGGSSSSGGCSSRGVDDITAPLPADLLVDWVRLYDNGYTQVYTPSPTPAPTLVNRNPETIPPTKRPTPEPTTLPPTTLPPTPAPVTPIPVTTNAPVIPVTQSPVIRQPGTSTGGGKAGGKAGKGYSGARSTGGGSRSSGGKSGKAGKGYGATSRQGTSGGKSGKGKAGKGKWSRSGSTATGRANDYSDGTIPAATPTAPSPAPTGLSASTRQTPLPTRDYPPPNPTDFEPVQEEEESPIQRLGPQSLVVEPFSGASTTAWYLSILLPGLVAFGLLTGVAAQW